MPRLPGVLGLLSLVALVLFGGCARCASKVEHESFVTVPIDLEAIEDLDDPPDVVVKIEKRAAPKGGGGGCGHSPVCIIIIPFVLAEALFPEKLRVVTITEKGKETYHGVFRENGQFVQALALKDGLWKKIALVQLPELGRNVVIEVEHAPPDAEGKPGTFARSSVQKQVDLLSGYRAAVGGTTEPTRRGRLLQEMLTHLHVEGLPLARERLLDAAEDSAVKQDALAVICSKVKPFGAPEEQAKLMKELEATKLDLRVSVPALGCFDPKKPEAARTFTSHVVDTACAAKESEQARRIAGNVVEWGASSAAVLTSVEPALARCAARERRQLLRLVLGASLDKVELTELAQSKDEDTASFVISKLESSRPEHREILLAALERPDSPLSAVLSALSRDSRKPDATEAKALAGAFLLRSKDAKLRAEVLSYLKETPDAERAPAKARLGQKVATSTGEERAALSAALVMLGEREREAGAARALVGLCPKVAEERAKPKVTPPPDAGASRMTALERAEADCRFGLVDSHWLVRDTPTLVSYVLQHVGCDESELVDIAASSPKTKTPDTGRICKQTTKDAP